MSDHSINSSFSEGSINDRQIPFPAVLCRVWIFSRSVCYLFSLKIKTRQSILSPINAHIAQTGVYVIEDKMFSNFTVPLLIKIKNAADKFPIVPADKDASFFCFANENKPKRWCKENTELNFWRSKRNLLPRCEGLTPVVIFIELHGCKLKLTIRLKCGKAGQKKKMVTAVFPGKVQPQSFEIWCLICQLNILMTAAGSQITNLILFS